MSAPMDRGRPSPGESAGGRSSVPARKPRRYPAESHAKDREQWDVSRDLFEVETEHVRHELGEHGVGRHEQRAEHCDEGHDDARPRATAAALRQRARGRRRHGGRTASHRRPQAWRPSTRAGAHHQRAGVSNDAGPAHPCRNRAMSREREGRTSRTQARAISAAERRATRARRQTGRRSPASRRARGPAPEPRGAAAPPRRSRPPRSTATGSDRACRGRAAAHRRWLPG